MDSQSDSKAEEESDLVTDSDTGAKESDLNDTLDSKYDSTASGSEKAYEKSSEPDNESEYESVDEDVVIPKKEPDVKDSEPPESEISEKSPTEDPLKSLDTKSESSFVSEKDEAEGELSISEDDLSDVHIEEEREEGDGEEESLSGKDKKLDDDEDRRNPQYIPKKGTFYEHDDRMDEGSEEIPNEKESEAEKDAKDEEKVKSKKEAALASKWAHDLYDDHEQAPKSTQELIDIYGYDIRNEEAPPKARRHRRYGRGPNKYTRNWEDENAYVKAGAPRGRGNRRDGGSTRGGKGGTFFADNENFNLEKEFPELKNKGNWKPPSEITENEPPKPGSMIKNSVFYSKAASQQQQSAHKPREQEGPFRKSQSLQQQVPKPSTEIKIDPGAISGKLHTSRNPPPPAFPPRNKNQAPKFSATTAPSNTQVNGSGVKLVEEKSIGKTGVRNVGQPSGPITALDFPRGRAKKVLTEAAYSYQQPVGVEHHAEPNDEELTKNFSHLQIEPTQHYSTSTASPTSVPMSHPIENHGIQDVNGQKLQQTQVATAAASSRGKRYSTQRQRSLPESGISFSPPPTAFQQPPQAHYYQPQTYGTQHQNVYTPKTPGANPVLTPQPSAQSPPMQLVYLQPPTQPPPPAQYQAPPPPIINYVPQPFTNPAAAYQQLTMPPPPPQPELYQQPSGITYYSAQTQAVLPRQTPPRRIKAAIPIVPPPESNSRGNRSSGQTEEDKNAREYYNQEPLESAG